VLEKFGIRISGIQFDWTGLCICCNETMLNRRRAFFAAAAGPAAGLFAAVLCSVTGNVLESDGLLLFSGVGVVFSCFNLLPAKPLDGWRMIRAICPALAQIISVCAALIILLAGLFCMILGYGTTLAFLGIVLLLEEPEEISARRIQYG